MAMLCLTNCTLNDFDDAADIENTGSPEIQFQYENVIVGKYLGGSFTSVLCNEDLRKCFSNFADTPVSPPEFRIIEGAFYLMAADIDSRIFLGLDFDGTDGYLRLNGTQIDCIGSCVCDWDGSACVCNGGGSGSCKEVKASGQ
jgi:hypothetical protein